MNLAQPNPQPRVSFGDDEPVIQSHPLLPDAQVPRFGDTERWNLDGVIRRPARLYAAAWTLVFSHELPAAGNLCLLPTVRGSPVHARPLGE